MADTIETIFTKDTFGNSEAIKSLPDDLRERVVAEILGITHNGAKALIDSKKVEWTTQTEKDVFEASGLEKAKKEDGKNETHYEYTRRVIKELKTKADAAADTTALTNLQKELEAAKRALKDNTGDATLKAEVEQAKQALADEKARVAAMQAEVKKIQETSTAQLQKEMQNLNLFKTQMEFEKAKAKFQFKPAEILGEGTADIRARFEFENILKTRPHEWRKGSDGSESLVFLKADGTPDYNPEKGYIPYTLADYLEKALDPILEKGHQATGGGTKQGSGGGGTVIVDLGFAKSKTQVNEIIRASLAKEGIPQTHPDYQKRYDEAKATVKNYAQLPRQ